ncbi:hypothetical protein IKG10_01220 [Candidatus Saccharibacteria bacterium]|nr:hypothetical protein [Candidatus Saccharibacteria bacterium]
MAKQRSKPKNARQRSFKRSYHEDYYRETSLPGITEHVVKSFSVLTKNYKIFLPLLIVIVIISIATVGLNGIIDQISTVIFATLIFLIIWLTTIFALRHVLAKHQLTFRDALYNAMTPLLSVFVVLLVIAVQCLPITILIVAYSAAVETDFLSMPFYALLFFVFALLMILMSGYMLSSSLVALVAVTAPGLYPLVALKNASDLMTGQRIKFILRLIALAVLVVLVWAIIVLPLKVIGAPETAVAVVQTIVFCACFMYITTYLYLYYRWMLDAENMLK